jgi:multisubunit Na+/H+ antiporter MnhE subunit
VIRLLAGAAVLCLIYVAVLGSADPLDLLVGALLGGIALAATRASRRPASPGLARRVVRFFPFAAVVLAEVVTGTWHVALVVLGVRPLRSPGIIDVPIGERTRRGLAVSTLALTLSPGSLLIDIDETRGVMLVHVIDATDAEEVRAKFEHFYTRWQRPVFP